MQPTRLKQPSPIEAERLKASLVERKQLRDIAKTDRATTAVHQWDFYKSKLSEIQKKLATPIFNDIKQRARGSAKPIQVLDLGCGQGQALKTLKRAFKGKVITTGFTVAAQPGISYKGVDHLITQRLGPKKEHEKRYDYIISHYGSTFHTTLLEAWVNRTASMLASGGKAVVMMPHYFLLTKEVKEVLERIEQKNSDLINVQVKHAEGRVVILTLEKK